MKGLAIALAALCAAWAFEARASDQQDAAAEMIGEVMALDDLCPLLRASEKAIVFLAAASDIALDDPWLKSAVRFHRDKAAAMWGGGKTTRFACETAERLYGPDGTKGPGMMFDE